MIIGKSITVILSGGLKPEIHVTAKAGALLKLRLKDSSIILQSYQLGPSETQHIFTVNMSDTAYIIDDATNGNSVEVLVNTVSLFNAQIQYAYITVTAKAGALLKLHLKNSSTILQSYQLGSSETQHTFIVNVNSTAYVIDDATNGNSVEVLVSSFTQYNVQIQYASIAVTAKAGALLKLHLKNSSTILQSYQLSASETTHTFIVGTNSVAYVIDDVTNSNSISAEVLVSSGSAYSTTIKYRESVNVLLYNNSDATNRFNPSVCYNGSTYWYFYQSSKTITQTTYSSVIKLHLSDTSYYSYLYIDGVCVQYASPNQDINYNWTVEFPARIECEYDYSTDNVRLVMRITRM